MFSSDKKDYLRVSKVFFFSFPVLLGNRKVYVMTGRESGRSGASVNGGAAGVGRGCG